MNPWRSWNRFWFGPISARPLGAFRVVFGLLLLTNLWFLAFDIDYWYTSIGMLHGTEAREMAGPFRHSPLQWIHDPTSIRLFFAATAVICVLFTIGWRTRLMGILVYLTMLSITHRNLLTNSGADTLVLIMCFYMMLAPCGAAYSLDARRAARRRGTPAEPLILPWAQRLIQLHICMIYFDTAMLKSNGATWLNGTALHFVLSNTEVGRFHFGPITQYPILINILTYGGLLIEFSMASLLWSRATRPLAILAGISLHVGILLTVNIPIFGEVMTACYLTFLTPQELDSFLRILDPRRWLAGARRRSEPLIIPGRIDGPSSLPGPHAVDQAVEPEHSTPELLLADH